VLWEVIILSNAIFKIHLSQLVDEIIKKIPAAIYILHRLSGVSIVCSFV